MQQYEEDSALPFAEIEENTNSNNNHVGSNIKRNNSQKREDYLQLNNQSRQSDQILSSYKKHNIHLVQAQHQPQKNSGDRVQLRNSSEQVTLSIPSLPRINGPQNATQDFNRKRYSQNISQNDLLLNNQSSNKKYSTVTSNMQMTQYGMNYNQKYQNGQSNYSIGGMNLAGNNMQINSAKFQKNIFKAITSSTSQGGLSFTQRVDNLSFPINSYQMQINQADLSSSQIQKNFRSTVSQLGNDTTKKNYTNQSELSGEYPAPLQSVDQSNGSLIQSKVKEHSHEIHKIISPKAYKVLKLKQIKNSTTSSSEDNQVYPLSSSQPYRKLQVSPQKQRLSSSIMDDLNSKEVGGDESKIMQQQQDIYESIKTLKDLKQPTFTDENMKEQVDKLKQSISRLQFHNRKSKNSCSISSLQDIAFQDNQQSYILLQDRLQTNFSQHGFPQIQISNIGSDQKSKLLDSTQKLTSQNQLLYAHAQVSQFNNSHIDNTQNESALLSQDKVSLIKEMNQKNNNKTNFYGQFISRCLEQTQKEISNTPSSINRKKDIFETDLEKIKVSSQLLDIIDKQVFQDIEFQEQTDQSSPHQQSNSHQTQILNGSKSPRKKQILNPKQKEKLFQVLAESDKIVVHTSQNKDLLVPSERKDVVRLAQWLEDMQEKIYNIRELDFYEYFENMQLVCSACMSELIRQINLSVHERGQLVKRVWESILNLMKQAFEQITHEKIENERSLKEEIKRIHKMYLQKLDEYLPEIEKYKKLVDQKEQQNKRVILEFRYLRKKDTKLEKYLKLAKKDLKVLEEEYQKLDSDYQKFKKSYEKQDQYYLQTIANLKQIQKSTQQLTSSISFNKNAQSDASQQLYNDHMKTYNEVTNKAKKGFDTFNQNFDQYNDDLKELHENYVKDLKVLQKNSNIKADEIDIMEERLYSKKEEIKQILELDDRILEEIEGSDGITLLIGHCSTQTGPDLLKMTHQSVDTSTLIQLKERTTQTFVAEIDVKEIQTPPEWMNALMQTSQTPQNNTNKNARSTKPSRFSSIMNTESQDEVENETDMQKQREEMEFQEQQKLEQMKQVTDITEEKEIEDRKKFQELPFIKQFLIDSPMLQKSGLLINWKDEKNRSKLVQQGGFQNYLEEDESESDANSDANIDNNKSNQQNSPELVSKRGNKKIHESLSLTINNKVEKDLDDLHTLVMSRTSYVTSICEKIINYDLLKENEHVSTQMIQQFINDSKQIILEETSRLQSIYERSKKGIIDQVKQKIMIAEKDAEIQEVQNDKVIFEQQIKLFKKEINSREDNKNEASNNTDGTSRKKTSQSFNSIVDITDEDEFYEANMSSNEEDDNISEEKSLSESVCSIKNDTSTIIQQDASGQKQDSASYKQRKSRLEIPNLKRNSTAPKKIAPQSLEKAGLNMNNSTKLNSPPVQQNQKKTKKKQTLNPLNRVSISLIEAVQGSKTQQKSEIEDRKQIDYDKRFIEINRRKEQSPSISVIAPSSAMVSSQMNYNLNSNTSNWLKTINIKKKKLEITSSSPNADSAAFFFNKTAVQIMNKDIKADGKTVVLKQSNVLRHISSIYQDKIKTIKTSDEEANGASSTLNVVTYDYFKNKFGFKKLAETKLKQFLDSCMYHSVNFKIRIFTKLYGINKIMNYDFQDFDFFIKMMIFLEDGSTPQQVLANIYPINKSLEALYRNFETKIPASEMIRLKQEMENMKIPDSTAKQKNKFAIDADHALDILLQALIEEKKICIQNLQSVYLAGDINCDQVIAFDEYLTLFRHFESDNFDNLSIIKFYYQNCDLLDRFTSQRIMSFQKFTLTSVQGDIFTKEVQDAYAAKIEPFDRIKNIEALEKYWEDKKDVIRLRFVKNNQYTILYKQMIKRIDDYFSQKKEERKQLEKNTTWFVYRLLDDESKRVMTETLITSFLPNEFNILTNFESNLIKKLCLNI